VSPEREIVADVGRGDGGGGSGRALAARCPITAAPAAVADLCSIIRGRFLPSEN